MVEDKAHFTNSEQEVQSEVVFGEAGKPASAVRIGDRCLTVLYPHDPADRFDYEYYRDHHMTSLTKLFGHEAISRMELRKSLVSPDGRNQPLYACTANIYLADEHAFAAAAAKNHQRVVDDIARFTSVAPILGDDRSSWRLRHLNGALLGRRVGRSLLDGFSAGSS